MGVILGGEVAEASSCLPFINLSPPPHPCPIFILSYFFRVNFQVYFISFNIFILWGRLFVFLFLVSLANLFSKSITFHGLP